jgi:hypothetical protein
MRRKEFFKNFANIIKFGIFGSLFTFVIFVVLTWLVFEYFTIDIYYPTSSSNVEKAGQTIPFKLKILEIMLVCSILVSSDIIAAMAILNFNE